MTLPQRIQVTVSDGIQQAAADARYGTLATINSTTSATLPNSHIAKVGAWVAFSPYTANCEIKKITAVSGQTVTVGTLVNSHGSSANVLVWDKQPEFDVKLYAAAGDDSTDDSAAFHNAIRDIPSSGGVVFVPDGTYRCNLDIEDEDYLTLRGGSWSSKLKMYDPDDYLLDIRTCDDLTIEYLSFDGRYGDSGTVRTTLLEALDNCEIHHCYFDNCLFRAINFDISIVSGAVEPAKNQYCSIHHCEFGENIERDAIYAGNMGHCSIYNNLIRSSPDYAIDTGGRSHNMHIYGNTILSCQGGIYGDAYEDNFVVTGNVVMGCTGNAVNCNGYDSSTRGVIIADNIFVGSPGQTAVVCSIRGARIEGNSIRGFNNQTIRAGAAEIVIQNNTFDTPGANYAVQLDANADRSVVTGNQFVLGSSQGGITSAADDVVVTGNFFATPDTAIIFTGTTSGHRIENNTIRDALGGFTLANVSGSVIKNNTFIDSSFNTDIVESGTANSNIIIDNIVRNRFAVTIVGAATIARRNTNFPSGTSGTATITSGNTSVTVTFSGSLTLAPSIQHISVTPTATWGSATKFWVSNVTSTTFQINVDAAPGASLTFAWRIEIVP